jgi:LysR family transcriptional regulator, glycine cleavage system transcriptional activator
MGTVLPLPSLSALRAFEAAARLGSFTKAGEELAMTQAAVSYQVKVLEDRLGVALFARVGRGVELTPAGRRMSLQVSEAFVLLRTAIAGAVQTGAGALQITAAPTLAANWLAPRIGFFEEINPQFRVRVDASSRVEDLRTSEFDVAIRMGKGAWPGCVAERLLVSEYTPVCDPELSRSLASPADLLSVKRFGPVKWWANWFEAACVAGTSATATDLATQSSEVTAALAQGGAAIVNLVFFADDLARGRLASPFAISATSGIDYWLVHRSGADMQDNIRAFKSWIMAEAARC